MNVISIYRKDYHQCLEIMNSFPDQKAFEFRLDDIRLTEEELVSFIRLYSEIIVSYRPLAKDEPKSRKLLKTAIEAGVKYIDIDISSDSSLIHFVKTRRDLNKNLTIIISWHEYNMTPYIPELKYIYHRCKEIGADWVKMVPYAEDLDDVSRLMYLYRVSNNDLIAFSMGEVGKISRRLALQMGSKVNYMAASKTLSSAPGQLTVDEIMNYLDKAKYPFCLPKHLPLEETSKIGLNNVTLESLLPSSKSYAQRTILCSYLSKGSTEITGLEDDLADDIISAINVIESLLVGINTSISTNTSNEINVGESGFLARSIIPIMILISDGKPFTLKGKGTLVNRNLSETIANLLRNNIECKAREMTSLPFTIYAKSLPKEIDINAEISSQLASGFLMILPFLSGRTLRLRNLVSRPYIDMTCNIMHRFSIKLECKEEENGDLIFSCPEGQSYNCESIEVEPDWSAAAPLYVYYAIASSINLQFKRIDLNKIMPMDSLQPDIRILQVLKDARGSTAETMKAFKIDATNCPDLIPTCVALAMYCDGKSEIKGVNRLYTKESNRAESIFEEFSKLGVSIIIDDDIMYVERFESDGKTNKELSSDKNILAPIYLSSHNDHRMIMALTVAASFMGNNVFIDEVENVKKSFPNFLKFFINNENI
ncbi:MAG: type I 3-dehydroquinate dehydratase [Bacteroidales bacterium]